MEIVKIIKEYWVQIIFLITILGSLFIFIKAMIEAVKCSLRNDILDIFDKCKDTKKITHYQLDAILHSSDLYFKLKGNSFVREVVEKVRTYEFID